MYGRRYLVRNHCLQSQANSKAYITQANDMHLGAIQREWPREAKLVRAGIAF